MRSLSFLSPPGRGRGRARTELQQPPRSLEDEAQNGEGEEEGTSTPASSVQTSAGEGAWPNPALHPALDDAGLRHVRLRSPGEGGKLLPRLLQPQ